MLGVLFLLAFIWWDLDKKIRIGNFGDLHCNFCGSDHVVEDQ